MRALPVLLGSRAPPLQPLLLLCLLAAARPSSADGQPPASPFTSLPVRDRMLAKYSDFPMERVNLSLTEDSNVAVEKDVTLQNPSNVELTCLLKTSGDLKAVNVTWKKDAEQLESNYLINATGETLLTQYTRGLTDYHKTVGWPPHHRLGRCKDPADFVSLAADAGDGATANVVPEIIEKNKPLITYVGDSTILTCKCQHCLPLNWTWYSANGSIQVPLDVETNNKYVINGTNANETRLKLTNLREEDQGSYWCRAAFPLGESEGRVELVVLSYLVPLKPFLAIVAEVVLLVTIILLCEVYSKKKRSRPDDGKEFEQIEQLKSDDSNGIENNAPRYRKNESVGQ